jgi:phage shock protein PspC (stress-responsive transcriptional regulator)
MDVRSVNRSQSERFGVYRNTAGGWIAGVCAGIAFVLLATIAHAIPAIILYVLCVLALKPRSVPAGYGAAPYSAGSPGYFADRFYPSAYSTTAPPSAGAPRLTDIASRFAALDARLNHIEAAVMSDELSLRRKFRDLGG